MDMKVLITDDVHPCLTEGLAQAGCEVIYEPGAGREEIKSLLPNCQAWILRTGVKADAEMLKAGTQLKWIGRAGAGLDNIDLDFASEHGIVCENAGEANADAVGEHTLGMLLMLLNHLGRANAEVRRGIWLREENRGVELSGKTIGIIGYGNTGSAVASKLQGFGVKVLAYDKYKQGFGSAQVKECTLEEVLANAQILSLHVPLTNETQHLLNESLIEKAANPFYLLNLSRGPVVKTQALIEGLKSGKVLGAALDVLENEKINSLNTEEQQQFNFLVNAPNVVLTPHIGGWTRESNVKISENLLNKFLNFSLNVNKR